MTDSDSDANEIDHGHGHGDRPGRRKTLDELNAEVRGINEVDLPQPEPGEQGSVAQTGLPPQTESPYENGIDGDAHIEINRLFDLIRDEGFRLANWTMMPDEWGRIHVTVSTIPPSQLSGGDDEPSGDETPDEGS